MITPVFWARPAGAGGQAGNIGVNVVAWEDSGKGCPVSWPACCWPEHAGRDLLVCAVCCTLMLVVRILSWSAKLRTHSSRVRKEETFGQLLPFHFPFLSANQATTMLVWNQRLCLTRIPKNLPITLFPRPWFITLRGHDEGEAVGVGPTPVTS